MTEYPSTCTGCDQFVYEDAQAGPCPICFPGLTRIEGATMRHDDDGKEVVVVATCGHCGRSWNDAASSSLTPAPSGRCPFEYEHEYEAERRPTDEQARALAREEYGCDKIEIDAEAVVSRDHHTHGAFVAAWVWVTFNPEGADDD